MASTVQQRKRDKQQQRIAQQQQQLAQQLQAQQQQAAAQLQQRLTQAATQIANILGRRLARAATVKAIATVLTPFGQTALLLVAIGLAVAILENYPQPRLEGIGEAQRATISQNELRRAAFLLNSIDRIQRELLAQLAQGATVEAASQAVRGAEERYFGQHVTASQSRMDAASKIDALQARYGDVLGWYAKKDKRATEECRNADGHNFSALTPPAIGWPGMVHVNCRCSPGPPHRRAAMLPSGAGVAA